MSLEYIQKYYEVPALKGARVKYGDKEGEIMGAEGQYLRIKLDGEQEAGLYHPLWNISYLRAYRVNDYEIYAGWNFESAVAAAMSDSGEGRESYYTDSREPLPDDYEFVDTDEGEMPIGNITVRAYIERDLKGPGIVAADW